MKKLASAFVVLSCLAGSATAATLMSTEAKVARFADEQLCFLETAAKSTDAVLVREELQSRNVACTPQMRSDGKVALEASERVANMRSSNQRMQNISANREYRDRQETQRLMRCTANGGQAEPGCRNGY